MEKSNVNHEQHERALSKMLADRDLRILLWRLISEYCHVFQTEYPTNAQAYTLLAEQRIGKILLAEIKDINAEAVFIAEAEYNALMKQRAAELALQNEME